MGLKRFSATVSGPPAAAEDERRRQRFGHYFPRLFAYVRPWVNSDARTRDIVVETFARAFAYPGEITDEEFAIVLFGLAREACQGRTQEARRSSAGLTAREREVVGLVFDAQMCRGEIARLLEIDEGDVTATLLQALKKLRSGAASVQALSLRP
jgi:DNA-directed RNA polymerase specialized sigma24 family protein